MLLRIELNDKFLLIKFYFPKFIWFHLNFNKAEFQFLHCGFILFGEGDIW